MLGFPAKIVIVLVSSLEVASNFLNKNFKQVKNKN
jgi:hypothetical protein